jgi:hypothetical protein
MINLDILTKIKKTSILFAISFFALIGTFVIYQTLDINGDNLKNEAKGLEESLGKLIKEKDETLKREKDTVSFLNKNKNIFFIDSKDQFDLIKFNKDIKKEFSKVHPNLKFISKGNLEKTKTELFQYPFLLEFKYKNPYHLNNLFTYLNENYFYEMNELTYDSKNFRFQLKGNLFSKKEVKNVLNGDGGNKTPKKAKK